MQGAEVLTKFTADSSQMDNATKNLQDNLKQTQKQGELAFLGLTTAVDAFVGAVIKGGIEYNAQMQTFNTRLTTLTGSAEGAEKVLSQIKKDALTTPFDVASLTQAESLLLSTGLSAEEARADILALGDAVSASGGGNAELQRMAVNLQQIKNVGKASSLDIKQFAYAGIDIYGLLADSMGITRAEASDLDVTYEMLTQALKQANSEGGKYYGAMESQSKTYNGAMSNLDESLQVLKGTLTEGLFNAISGLIPKLTEMFDWLAKNKDIVIAIAVPLLTFINVLAGVLIVGKITAMFKGLWLVLTANPIGLIIALISALVAGFIYLWNNCEGFRNFWIALWNGLKATFVLVVSSVMSGINSIINAFKKIGSVIASVWNGVKKTFSGMVKGMTDIGSNIGKGLWGGLSKMKDWVIDKVKGMGKAILGGLKKVLGINSPSKQFAIVGKYSAEGYVEGLDGMQKEIDKSVSATFNPFTNGSIGSMTTPTPTANVTIHNSMEMDSLGQLVNSVKTFSGGAKNDYNYVGGY